MKKLIIFVILLFTLTVPATAGQLESRPVNRDTVPVNVLQTKELDPRAAILADYFAKYNSPFENHAQDFIDAADTYGVDWKLVPAISGVESTFGKQSYGYNAWGWGIYGDQRLNFGSWRTGIFTVTEGLKTGYINKGLTDPFSMNKVYASSPTWGTRVNYFMNDLDKFANDHPSNEQSNNNPQPKIAAESGRLAFKAQ